MRRPETGTERRRSWWLTLMEKSRVKRLPVVEAGRPVGIISRADVLRAVATRMADHTSAGDRAVRAQVLEELRGQSWVTIPDRNIVVSDGVVGFWGDVASDEERRALCVAAGRIPGVRAVEGHMTVRPTVLPAGATI